MECRPMELKDTIPLMTSADYRERFKAELAQLRIRRQKLTNLLDKMELGTLDFEPKCSFELLADQHDVMLEYEILLFRRAEVEGIDLGEMR